jgi:hypothetical protein
MLKDNRSVACYVRVEGDARSSSAQEAFQAGRVSSGLCRMSWPSSSIKPNAHMKTLASIFPAPNQFKTGNGASLAAVGRQGGITPGSRACGCKRNDMSIGCKLSGRWRATEYELISLPARLIQSDPA